MKYRIIIDMGDGIHDKPLYIFGYASQNGGPDLPHGRTGVTTELSEATVYDNPSEFVLWTKISPSHATISMDDLDMAEEINVLLDM